MPDFTSYPDLASRDLAGSVISANDELFAPRQNLIMPTHAVHAVDSFGHTGKVYDGWETRRRREPGCDWVIVRLGVPGVIHGVVVDTAFFKGNYPPHISIEATSVEGYPSDDTLPDAEWEALVDKTDARGDTENYYPVDHPGRWTHVRLTIYPDGGVARLRVHGEVVLDPRYLMASTDLVALENGGRLLGTSDAFYSSPVNLILPSRARLMGEGWENARRRGPGHDWAVFQLGVPGRRPRWRSTRRTSSATPPTPYACPPPTPTTDRSTARSTKVTRGGTWCLRLPCWWTPVTASWWPTTGGPPICASTSTPTAA